MLHILTVFHMLILTSITTLGESSQVVLKEFGVNPLGGNDIALVFYATIENNGQEPYTVGLKMEKCCQFINKDDIDCESMILHSGLSVELYPGDVRNFSMYYTNLYLLGRNGSCSILMRWRPIDISRREPSHEQFNVPFNTILPDSNSFLQNLKTNGDDSTRCSFDEDPTNGCKPVNCLIKYSGFRSFFNKVTKLCQKSPVCAGKGVAEDKPEVVLSPISNKCISMNTPRSYSESMQSLSSGMESIATDYQTYPMKTSCVNGWINSEKNCICNQGWTSQKFDGKTFNPEFDTYTLCDILSSSTQDEYRVYGAAVSALPLIILALSALILACVIPLSLRKINRRKHATSSEQSLPEYDANSSKVPSPQNSQVVLPFPTYSTRKEIFHPQEAHNKLKLDKPNTGVSQKPGEDGNVEKLQDISPITKGNQMQHSQYSSPPSMSKNRASFIESTKSFLPQIPRSNQLPVSHPLSFTAKKILTINKYTPTETDNIVPSQSKENSIATKESPSFARLKRLLNEVEHSTKLLEVDISEVTDGVTQESLDQFSAANLESSYSDTPIAAKEFWESVSDSDEDTDEAMAEENKPGFWVNKLQAELLIDLNCKNCLAEPYRKQWIVTNVKSTLFLLIWQINETL